MTPALETALATPHAKRLLRIAAEAHQTTLAKLEANNKKAGYPEVASVQRGDGQLIGEVILPALTEQTTLGLDAAEELQNFLAIRFRRHLKRLKAEIARLLMEEKDAVADEAVEQLAVELGQRMSVIATMIAERAHHDGLCARLLMPKETLLRVLGEVSDAGDDPATALV